VRSLIPLSNSNTLSQRGCCAFWPVIVRSDSDEAIQVSTLHWIASLRSQ
jgi:hypothetical protein